MNPIPGKSYGPSAKLDYQAPLHDIRVVWKASTWSEFHQCSVRGVPVDKLDKGNSDKRSIRYAWCRFPDGRVMLVNEGNIRIKKVSRHGNTIAGIS